GLQLHDVEVAFENVQYDIIKFDLELTLSEQNGEVTGSLGYSTALFDRQTIDRHIGYLEAMLKWMTVNMEQPICYAPILGASEQELLLQSWNATDQPYPDNTCIHHLFENQVKSSPEAIAIVHDNRTLTYHELNSHANGLAQQLVEVGVKPGDFVLTLLNRSIELVAVQIALLKAGAAYVPIDTKDPVNRHAYIASDCGAKLLVTDEHTVIPTLIQIPIFRLRICDTRETNKDDRTIGVNAGDAAYAMYTSGSTGLPKGVIVPHRAISRLVINSGYANIGPEDSVAFAANPAFDLSTFEMWAPLLNGGRLVIIDANTVACPQLLAEALNRHQINTLWLTMAFFNQYIHTIGPALAKLKYLLCGGEQGNLEAFAALLQHGGPQHLINGYGPTETTTFATTYKALNTDRQLERLPIGRPIGNTRVYVLDKHRNPLPIGAVGELYVGGPGIANGYLNRPDLTAERFLSDPFSKDEGARMYKTGDLVRYLRDGNLVFMGRNDDQVKIRGFRIELGEIEARLVGHPQVHQAVVLATGETSSDKRLVAYIVADANEQLAHMLREHLVATLPEYMIPLAFVRMDAFPLTNNGKIDRRALPEPGCSFVTRDYVAPQGEVEVALANIWAELLKIEQVGRFDNFFMLGGHSLLAVRLMNRVSTLGFSLSVRTLFDNPMLSVLAASLSKHQKAPEAPSNLITEDTTRISPDMLPLIDLSQVDIDHIVDHVPGGVANIQDIYALSPLQDGILFHYMMAAKGDPYMLLGCTAFESRELLDSYLIAFQKVVDRHDVLRTAIMWENLTSPAQVVLRRAALSLTELSLDPANGPIVEQVAKLYDSRDYRIDLSQAPLIRYSVVQDTDGRWILAQQIHHVVGDHSTLDFMEEEIKAFMEGQGESLTAPQPFRNLVAQARLGISVEEHERFFCKMLQDIDTPSMPYGLSDIHNEGHNVTDAHQMLPQNLNDKLRGHTKRLGVSLAALCHLAWAQVIAATSGQAQVVFGTVLFGRMQGGSGSDRALGLYINTLPLRVDVEGNSVLQTVRRVQADLVALLEHEHASLALAQRCSSVPSGMALFSAILNYRHNATPFSQTRISPGMENLMFHERTNYPLAMSVEDFGTSLGLTAQIVQPYDPSTICAYMQQALHNLGEALEHAPETPIQALD
ncbi:hypothetical protein BG005_003096, partial [Podila minutissima]